MAMRQEIERATLYTAASDIEAALSRLESGVRIASERLGGIPALENEAMRLANERAQLANALDRMTIRANKLDKTAADVSRRLIEAMEKVRSALSKEEV